MRTSQIVWTSLALSMACEPEGECPEGTLEVKGGCVQQTADDAGTRQLEERDVDSDAFPDAATPDTSAPWTENEEKESDTNDESISGEPNCTLVAPNEAPHPHGLDERCHELSGRYIYVAQKGSDNTGNGSPASPFETLTRAIREAAVRERAVVAATGSYEEPDVTLEVAFVRVFGGYDPEGWSRTDHLTHWQLGPRGVLLKGLSKSSRLDHLEITSASATAETVNAIALRVAGQSAGPVPLLEIVASKIKSGPGAPGADGTDGQGGPPGNDGSMGCPSDRCSTITSGTFYGGRGGGALACEGATSDAIGAGGGSSRADGGDSYAGTPGGTSVAGGATDARLEGQDGSKGNPGKNGQGGTEPGSWSFEQLYAPPRAESGSAGIAGTGGGGGAGGAGRYMISGSCSSLSAYQYNGYPDGSSGGGGGSGGCGGLGGSGGTGGGASIGIAAERVVIALTDTLVETAGGGMGGSGGGGGLGGPGGHGGLGGKQVCGSWNDGSGTRWMLSYAGGPGGEGGVGGIGGVGGGGIGGPSIGIRRFSGANVISRQGARIQPGPGGQGGQGGLREFNGADGESAAIK